jgi:hypothetical protein
LAISCAWIHFYLESRCTMKITRRAFADLFRTHVPEWLPSAWVLGVRYVFVAGTDEIEELERLLGGVTSGKV